MNARGQYGSRPVRAEHAQCTPERGQYRLLGADAGCAPELGQYSPLGATRRVSERGQYGPLEDDTKATIMSLALHVAGILLIGLGLAYLLIRWSGA